MDNLILSQIPIDDLATIITEKVMERLSQTQPAIPANPARLITEKELCTYLNINPRTALRKRQRGQFPFLRVSGEIRYDLKKVLKHLESK